MKKSLVALLLALCLLMVAGCNSSTPSTAPSTSGGDTNAAAPKQPIYLEYGGSGTGTFVYSAQAAIGEMINSKSDWINVNVQTTAGSVAHYKMFADGLIQIGSGSGYSDYQSWNAESANFPDPLQAQRTIIVFSRNFQTILVPASSNIYTMSDLNGKRLAIGAAGAPTTGIAEATLSALGIQAEMLYSTMAEQVEMYKDGLVDCFFLTSAGGNANVLDATTSVESRLVTLTDEEIEKCVTGALKGKSSPDILTNEFYSFIPEGEEIRVMNDHSTVNVIAELDDDAVYEILTIYWDNQAEMRETLKGLNGAPEHILLATTYVHPAAARFYKDRFNIEIPAEKIKG